MRNVAVNLTDSSPSLFKFCSMSDIFYIFICSVKLSILPNDIMCRTAMLKYYLQGELLLYIISVQDCRKALGSLNPNKKRINKELTVSRKIFSACSTNESLNILCKN